MREHTAALRAPRALWVPFILGRPFGVPNDAAFQRRVLLAALRLLDAPAGSGPLLEDFPHDAPQSAATSEEVVYLIDFIENNETPLYREALARGLSLRLACEDLKAYYLEAVNAQPGHQAAQQAHAWFWRDTVAGRVLIRLRAVCLASADESVKQFGLGNLVPRAIVQTQAAETPRR